MKIVYLAENFFTRRDYYRYGIEELIGQSKFEVEVWDISRIIHPDVNFNYSEFKHIPINDNCNIIRLNSLYDFQKRVLKTSVFYCMVLIAFNLKTLPLFKILAFCDIKCISTGIGMINVQPKFNYRLINTQSGLKKLYNITLRRLLSLSKMYFYLILIRYHKIVFFETYFLSGGLKTSVDNILVSKKTRLIRLHSNNYDIHLREHKNFKKRMNNNYDIYIDQNIPVSSDSILRGEKLSIPAKKYYQELNRFFDSLEKVTRREIIISAHPKCNLDQLKKYNSNRRIVFSSNSANDIFFAKNVIVCYSMAISFAILYKKNLILITNTSINKYKKSILNGISKYLKIKYVNISEQFEIKNSFITDKSMYSAYSNDFITPSLENDTLFSLQIFNFMNSANR